MLAAHNRLIEQMAARWTRDRARAPLAAWQEAMRTRCGGSARRGPRPPAAIATSSCAAFATGAGLPGGRDGTMFTVAGDAYGVIVRYVASLAGLGPRDHGALHRAACLAFTAVSLPFQFLPLAIALAGKSRELRTVGRSAGA